MSLTDAIGTHLELRRNLNRKEKRENRRRDAAVPLDPIDSLPEPGIYLDFGSHLNMTGRGPGVIHYRR
jgi:hypothetical protein